MSLISARKLTLALTLFPMVALAQTPQTPPPVMVIPTQALSVLLQAYLHPSKVDPGDAIEAVLKLQACATVQALGSHDFATCPDIKAAAESLEVSRSKGGSSGPLAEPPAPAGKR